MSSHHNHVHTTKNIGITVVLNLVITIAELTGGIISVSMALLSDAVHNFSDVLSLIISYIARKLAGRRNTYTRTFGYRRAEIFAGFINSLTLMTLSIILIIEASRRLFHPVPVQGNLVIGLAALSILLNGVSVLLIRKDAKSSMNMRSSLLHLFTDMLTSVAVLAGGFAMKYLNWYWLDPILTLAIGFYLIYASWDIFSGSVKIFMEFTPQSVDVMKIAGKISEFKEIKNIHHIHCWQLDDHDILFEGHVDMAEDILLSEFDRVLSKIELLLKDHGINHVNIQPELNKKHKKTIIV